MGYVQMADETHIPIHPNAVVAWIGHQFNCLVYGQAIIAMIFYACALGVAFGAYVKVVCGYSAGDTHWIAVLTVFVVVMAQHRIGWLLDRWGIIRASNEWHARRTQLLVEMSKEIKKGGK